MNEIKIQEIKDKYGDHIGEGVNKYLMADDEIMSYKIKDYYKINNIVFFEGTFMTMSMNQGNFKICYDLINQVVFNANP